MCLCTDFELQETGASVRFMGTELLGAKTLLVEGLIQVKRGLFVFVAFLCLSSAKGMACARTVRFSRLNVVSHGLIKLCSKIKSV